MLAYTAITDYSTKNSDEILFTLKSQTIIHTTQKSTLTVYKGRLRYGWKWQYSDMKQNNEYRLIVLTITYYKYYYMVTGLLLYYKEIVENAF